MGKTKGFFKASGFRRRDGWSVGEAWVDGMGLRVGFININDMYNNDVGKGVIYAYEASEVK